MQETNPSLWLLDTNTITALMKQPHGLVTQRMSAALRQHSDAEMCTSAIVVCEMQFGLLKNPSPRLLTAYAQAMLGVVVYPLDEAVPFQYAKLRHHLAQQSTPIGPNDTLIAAHALALGATLVTDNETEFRRVPGLQVENWLR